MINREILKKLMPVTEEEQAILTGGTVWIKACIPMRITM